MASTHHACERQPCHGLVSSRVKLERTQCKENCCAACNSKHQCVLQCVVASVRSAGLARLRDNRVSGGIGVCVDKTIADVGSVYNRDVFLALVDLDLEGYGERVARSNVLSPGYGTCSWVVGAAVISGAINISCVLWDDIGDGDIASSVGSVGVGNGVRKHLTRSYPDRPGHPSLAEAELPKRQ